MLIRPCQTFIWITIIKIGHSSSETNELFLQDISTRTHGWAGDQWILYWGCWELWGDYWMCCWAVNRQWQRVWFQPVAKKSFRLKSRSPNSEARPPDHHTAWHSTSLSPTSNLNPLDLHKISLRNPQHTFSISPHYKYNPADNESFICHFSILHLCE